jgi:drug/metabolite transporter (DMT)-like permease
LTLPSASGADPNLLGDALTLGCAFFYACHISFTEKFARRSSPTALVTTQLVGSAVLCGVSLLFFTPKISWSWSLGGAVALCAIVASAFAQSLQTWAQQRTTAVRVALIFALEPVFASAYSAALGRERIGTREIAGGGLIVAGVLMGELGGFFWSRWRARRPLGQAGAPPAQAQG